MKVKRQASAVADQPRPAVSGEQQRVGAFGLVGHGVGFEDPAVGRNDLVREPAARGARRRSWQTLQARGGPLPLRSRTPVAPIARGTRRQDLPSGSPLHVHLDPLDHFVTDRLGLSYVRYVDDFLVFADDKRRLHQVRLEVERFLETLRLQIHQNKSVVFPCEQGIRFLGYRVFPTHRLLAAGKRPTVPSPDALDAARVCPWSHRVRRDPPPDHELDRSRPPCQHLSPPDRPVL